jgi:hypothetical protein
MRILCINGRKTGERLTEIGAANYWTDRDVSCCERLDEVVSSFWSAKCIGGEQNNEWAQIATLKIIRSDN